MNNGEVGTFTKSLEELGYTFYKFEAQYKQKQELFKEKKKKGEKKGVNYRVKVAMQCMVVYVLNNSVLYVHKKGTTDLTVFNSIPAKMGNSCKFKQVSM